ncbi:MAG: hypothetical protein JO033_27705 [Acidobacteriaceae bacterium]|nr:hypothetical protein [Acidobacteriota bacterium]MBV8812474.1 hypothetical protein [Acidobacteriaceae bacterium]MBV9501308.1 hypothetical protein [Acidobacteriaceae bacterium]
MNKADAKERFAHEMKEFFVVFLFLAPFFISFATFRMYVTGEFQNAFFRYGTALVNALILAKIVLIGEIAKLGKRSENKPLIVSTVYKSLVFSLFYLAFHVLEGTVRGLVHRQAFFGALHAATVTQAGELLSVGLVMFFAFIPFFALRETRRVIGADKFRHLFFGAGRPPHSEELGRHAVA